MNIPLHGGNMVSMVTLLGAGVFAVIIRVCARLKYPKAYTNDTYYHFLCADEIRTNGFKIPKKVSGLLWAAEYTYPPLYHYLLARLGKINAEKFSSIACDILQSFFVLVTSFTCLKSLHWQSFNALFVALCVSLAFLLSPSLNAYVSGPRAMNGTTRTLGEMFFGVALSMLLCWTMTGNYLYLVVCIVALSFLFMASKFAIQVLASTLIVFIIFMKWQWLAIIACSFCVSAIISKGHTFKVLRGHLWHSRFYLRFLQGRYYGYERFFVNIPLYVKDAFTALRSGVRPFWRWFIDARYAPHGLLFHNIPLWAVIAFMVTHVQVFSRLTGQPAVAHLVILSLIPLPAAIITSFPFARFLGENYRYLEYTQWAYWLLLVIVSPKSFFIIAPIVALYSLFLLINHVRYLRVWHDTYIKNEFFFKEVKSRLEGKPVYTISGNFWEIRFRACTQVLWGDCNFKLENAPLPDLEILYGRFPFPSSPAYQSSLVRNGIKYLVVNKAHFNLLGQEYFNRMRQVLDSGDYCLFEMEVV